MEGISHGNRSLDGVIGALDTTIRLKYSLSKHPTLTTSSALADFLSTTFGPVDSDSIVIRSNTPKNAPSEPPKKATALVPFKKIGDAFKVICAAGSKDKGLGDVKVDWAGGVEPPVLVWLRKRGMLGSRDGGADETPVGNENNGNDASLPPRTDSIFTSRSNKSSIPVCLCHILLASVETDDPFLFLLSRPTSHRHHPFHSPSPTLQLPRRRRKRLLHQVWTLNQLRS